MQHNILKHGFTYCDIIYLLSGNERLLLLNRSLDLRHVAARDWE